MMFENIFTGVRGFFLLKICRTGKPTMWVIKTIDGREYFAPACEFKKAKILKPTKKDEIRNEIIAGIFKFYENHPPKFSEENGVVEVYFDEEEKLQILKKKLDEYDSTHYKEWFAMTMQDVNNNPYFSGMNNPTIYDVHFHDGKDYYFGSISAIYTKFTAEELGVAMQTLYQKGMQVGDFYESKKCVIRRGELIRKPKK